MVRRRRHPKGYLYKTGKRRKVWRARWVEPVMFADGTIGSKPDDLIFPSRKGTALRRNNLLRRVLYPACDKIGIQRIGWHGLRHLHSTLQSEAGVPMKVVQAQMGHADLETTLTIYTHVVPGSQRRAVGKLEELIFPNFPKFTSVDPEPESIIQ